MPTGYLSNPLIFLVNTLVGAYVFVLILRLLLQYSGADSRNPISAFIIKVTQIPLKALRPIFPTVKGVNLAAIVLMLVLQMLIGFAMLSGLPGGNIWAIFIWSVAELIVNVINVFTYSIFIMVILSWINPGAHNPIIDLLYKITEPVLKPCQRYIPLIGGLDLSPMAALLGLQILKMLILPPLHSLM
ncbi:MAG: YggT family protein [Piscirickettsiaceae bacterium]|nr:MAG: YggT family protein [Piscirickettsiaceae bacterium]